MATAKHLLINLYRFARGDVYRRLHFALRPGINYKKLRPLSQLEQNIVKEVSEKGYARTTLEDLGLNSSLLQGAIEKGLPKLKACAPVNPVKPYSNQLQEPELIETGLLYWGLDEKILEIATHYLQTPVAYQGMSARRDDPDGIEIETRIWHRDPEDWKILKVIIYLNDIDADSGPFECIPKKFTSYLDWFPKNWKGRLENSQKLEQWKVSLTGKKGTVVFVDTCRVYHRGKMSTKSSRYALFYYYHPKNPSFPETCKPTYVAANLMESAPIKLSAFQLASIESRHEG